MPYFNYKNKKVYYEEIGQGEPLIFLHGNSVSSKMFMEATESFQDAYKMIFIDFLGHGNSERLEQFPEDFWYDEAMQTIECITANGYGKVYLIGSSGGALAALNVALERPDLVKKLAADSFEGEKSIDTYAEHIFEERENTKKQEQICMMWEYCHRKDWEKVVDNDTDVIIRHNKRVKNFFHKDLSRLKIPVMLSVSLEDDEYGNLIDIESTYRDLQRKIPKAEVHFFTHGGHPAMLSNRDEFVGLVKKFFE